SISAVLNIRSRSKRPTSIAREAEYGWRHGQARLREARSGIYGGQGQAVVRIWQRADDLLALPQQRRDARRLRPGGAAQGRARRSGHLYGPQGGNGDQFAD